VRALGNRLTSLKDETHGLGISGLNETLNRGGSLGPAGPSIFFSNGGGGEGNNVKREIRTRVTAKWYQNCFLPKKQLMIAT